MSRSDRHLLAGALAGVAPDLALLAFGWRATWLPETHPLVRLHRALHGPAGLALAALLGWASHLLLDARSRHRTRPEDPWC